MLQREWDLSLHAVLGYINGIDYIRRISERADMDLSLVRLCIQQLIHYGVVALVDIFQYSNIYAVTPGIRRLYDEPELTAACIEFVKKDVEASPSPTMSGPIFLPAIPTGKSGKPETTAIRSAEWHILGNSPSKTASKGPPTPSEVPEAGGIEAKAEEGIATLRPASSDEDLVQHVPVVLPPRRPPPTSHPESQSSGHGTSTPQLHEERENSKTNGTNSMKLQMGDVISIYSAFGTGERASGVFIACDTSGLHLDERRLVCFGIIHGIIRRVHEYPTARRHLPPIPVVPPPTSGATKGNNDEGEALEAGSHRTPSSLRQKLRTLFDGTVSVEVACCQLCRPYEEIARIVYDSGDFEVLRC